VETPECRLLVDAGFSLRQIRQRLAGVGRSVESLTGVLVTHEHSDHVQGLGMLTEKLRLPVYCNQLTREAIEQQMQVRLDCRIFATGSAFEVGDVLVETFSLPHDAQDRWVSAADAGGKHRILTDLGHATRLVLERVRPAHVLVLESNHDIKLLQDCPHRPWPLKQRILGRHGHLSNEAAADAAEQVMSGDLRHLYLGHLSRECNRPELAHEVMGRRLERIGATHVSLTVTSQSVPCPTLELG
jgi:phosphoribosyl 1,2-cyclic phosphodiesterase